MESTDLTITGDQNFKQQYKQFDFYCPEIPGNQNQNNYWKKLCVDRQMNENSPCFTGCGYIKKLENRVDIPKSNKRPYGKYPPWFYLKLEKLMVKRNKSNRCKISLESIGKKLGISRRTVSIQWKKLQGNPSLKTIPY